MAQPTSQGLKLCRRCAKGVPQQFNYCPRCGGHHWSTIITAYRHPVNTDPIQESRANLTPWNGKDVGKGIVFFVGQTIAVFLLFLLALTLVGRDEGVGIYALLVTLITEGILVSVVWLFAVAKYRISWSALGFWRRPAKRDALVAMGAVLAGLAIEVLYLTLLDMAGVDTERLAPSTFLEEGGVVLILLALMALLVAPVAEELFFRGFVFRGLTDRFGFWRAALISGGVFALAHVEPVKFLPLLALGMLLAWAYYRTGALWAPMLTHFLNNALAVAVLLA